MELLNADLLTGRKFPRQSSGHFRPSEASVCLPSAHGPRVLGKCARAIWYRLAGIEKTDTEFLAHQVMRMDVGKQVENAFIERCKEMGIYAANNVPFSTKMGDIQISGEIDAVLRTKPCGSEFYCTEVKSVYGFLAQKDIFGKMLNPRGGVGSPRDSHLMQLGLYLYHYSRFPKDHPAHLPFGALFYCDRGDGHTITYDVYLEKEHRTLPEGGSVLGHRIAYVSDQGQVPYTVTEIAIEDILQRLSYIQRMLKEKKVPPRDYCHEYNAEQVELYHKLGRISDSAYKKWKSSHGPRGKGKEVLGDWQCYKLYCPWSTRCRNEE